MSIYAVEMIYFHTPAHPSGRLCSQALRNYRDKSPHKRQQPVWVTISLKQSFQLTSRRKILPAQLLPTKQTDRKQINSQETRLEGTETRVFVSVAWQCQQCHHTVTLTSIMRSHLQLNMHDFHKGQLFKGKTYSASVPLLLFCFAAFTCSSPSIPPHKNLLHWQEDAWKRTAVFGPVFHPGYLFLQS